VGDRCIHCEQRPQLYRQLCRRCYDKFRECGLELPPRRPAGRPGRSRNEALRELISLASPETRRALAEALAARALGMIEGKEQKA
jgi:predicted amidophosphoribosyltransferase